MLRFVQCGSEVPVLPSTYCKGVMHMAGIALASQQAAAPCSSIRCHNSVIIVYVTC